MTNKKIIALIAGIAIAGVASAAPIDFSSDFSEGPDWNWDSTDSATGTGAMTVNPESTTTTTGYAKKLITADGDTETTIDYSFDLDISALLSNVGTGSQMTLFSIGASGNSGPIVGGVDGCRTWVYLVSGNDQGIWGFGVGSGGVWNGSEYGELEQDGVAWSGRQALTTAQQSSLHFAGTLTITDSGTDSIISNYLKVTAADGYETSSTTPFTTAALTGAGANTIDSYNIGALEDWAKENLSGDIVFDNFELTVNGGLPPEPATLSISVVSAEQIEISWVPNLPGYILQETSDLLSTNWADSASSSTNHPIQIPTTSAMFYRVIAP